MEHVILIENRVKAILSDTKEAIEKEFVSTDSAAKFFDSLMPLLGKRFDSIHLYRNGKQIKVEVTK